MPLFEIFIPAREPDGFNITARIRADSWIQALQNGLAKLGDVSDVRNVLCDINEHGIDVTEPTSGRVFRIRELDEARTEPAAPPVVSPPAAPKVEPALPAAGPTVPPAVPVAVPAAAPHQPAAAGAGPTVEPAMPVAPPPALIVPRPVESAGAGGPSEPVLLTRPARAAVAPTSGVSSAGLSGGAALADSARPRFFAEVQEESLTREKSSPGARLADIGRPSAELSPRSIDDVIADLFEATQELYAQPDLRAAAGFILDLAMRTVPAESGAVFIFDINHNDLYFAAARGPKANEVMGFRVPMGRGIVGFCAQEGVALAVSDVERDPRFYAAISQRVGYETRSILCSPAQKDGRVFGAVELINKAGSSSFAPHEIDLLNYLAHTFAEYLIQTGQVVD